MAIKDGSPSLNTAAGASWNRQIESIEMIVGAQTTSNDMDKIAETCIAEMVLN